MREENKQLTETFICPCIASIYLNYNQQDATFSRSIYFYKLLYMFQTVPPPINRTTKLYIQRQVLSNQYCCLLLSWMRWNACVPSHPRQQLAPVLVWQYLTLYVQFCGPVLILWITTKKMQRFLDLFISINCSTCFRRFLRPSTGPQNCTYSVRYCQTNTGASCCRGWDGTHAFHLIHDSSRQQYWFYNTRRCMYNFVVLLMGGGTAWNMYSNLYK